METELAMVAPMIEEARQAVGQIRSEHLSEIRSLKAPPDAIRDVLEGVLRLMGQADTSWNSMKKFLGNRGVKVRQTSLQSHVTGPEDCPWFVCGDLLGSSCCMWNPYKGLGRFGLRDLTSLKERPLSGSLDCGTGQRSTS